MCLLFGQYYFLVKYTLFSSFKPNRGMIYWVVYKNWNYVDYAHYVVKTDLFFTTLNIVHIGIQKYLILK